MVAREQHLRHSQAVPFLRPRILRVFEQSVPVALVREADLITEHARHEARHRVHDAHRRQLAAGQHEVANRNFLIHALVEEPLVDALIVPADQNQRIIVPPELLRLLLLKHRAARREIDRVRGCAQLITDRRPAAVERVALHHRAAPAAIGIVVHLILFVRGIVPDLMRVDLNESFFLRAAQNTGLHHRVHGLRKERHDVKPHRSASPPAAARG